MTFDPHELEPPLELDEGWRPAIESLLQPCLELLFPQVAAAIDWTAPVLLRSTELHKLWPDSERGTRYVDVLVEVRLLDGQQRCLLIHVEVQAQEQAAFPERLFTYNTFGRIHFGRRVLSAAILADDRPGWRPAVYEDKLPGFTLRMEYPVAKLLDFKDRKAELEASDNPFSVVLLATLAAMETRGEMELRYKIKWRMLRDVYRKIKDDAARKQLLRFLDFVLRLPKTMDLQCWQEVHEETQPMAHLTLPEREALAKGKAEGHVQAIVDLANDGVLTVAQARAQLQRLVQRGDVPQEMADAAAARLET